MRVLLLLAFLCQTMALLVSPLAAHSSLRAMSPAMACNGGKGGSGGMAPKLDKMRRGRFKALVNAADSADKVKSILLTSQTEGLLLKMNWKVRGHCNYHLRKRASEFEVDVPAEFAAANVRPRNTPKSKLSPTILEMSPVDADAVAALKDLRWS